MRAIRTRPSSASKSSGRPRSRTVRPARGPSDPWAGAADIVTGLQLLSHCYLLQAHSVIRPVQENCELLDLFAADSDAAEPMDGDGDAGKGVQPAGGA
jgi:hypothetical protein